MPQLFASWMYDAQNDEQAADGVIAIRAFVAHDPSGLAQSAVGTQSRYGFKYSERTIGITVDDVFLQSSVQADLSKPGMHAACLAHVRLQYVSVWLEQRLVRIKRTAASLRPPTRAVRGMITCPASRTARGDTPAATRP